MASPYSGTPLRDLGPHGSSTTGWSAGDTPDSSSQAAGLLSRRRLPYADLDTDADEAAAEGFQWKKILVKVIVSILGFLLISLLIEHFANDFVTRWSKVFIKKVGLPGLFTGVFLFDGVPQPFTYVPLIFLAIKGGVSKWEVFGTCMAASYSAALSGYAVGSFLRGPTWGRDLFDVLKDKYPFVPDLMERRGAVGVLLAAALPVPLAVATWTAGFFSVNIPSFLVAALGRCPKILVFVLLSPGPAAEGNHSASSSSGS